MRTIFLIPLLSTAAVAADLPAENQATPIDGLTETFNLKSNGGWCWYQGPRAIVTKDGHIVFTTIAGDTFAGYDAGDLWATSWDPSTGKLTQFELHDGFHRDDHDVAGLLERPDGRILAVYGKHANDRYQRWRITRDSGDISAWTDEKQLDVGSSYTYSNVFQLTEEHGRIYNFSRTRGFNPNCTISDDNGDSWKYGWRLLSWEKHHLKNNPGYTGIDGTRPYLRYASNGTNSIHFVTTEDHPRAFDNSIYHGFYRDGKLHGSDGQLIGEPGLDGKSSLTPTSFTRVFEGGRDRVAWTVDLELDSKGQPYTVFSVQTDGAAGRGKRGASDAGQDHRYWYARYDGKHWHSAEIAKAGTRLYAGEDDYTGLAALDPGNPDRVVISTNAHPVSGAALMSKTDGKRHWELFAGRTTDRGATWKWAALTQDSEADNLRPLIPASPAGGPTFLLWCRGQFTTFKDYRLNICGRILK